MGHTFAHKAKPAPTAAGSARVLATGSAKAHSLVHDVLRSPGRPLDPETRAYMEPRFGHDFSKVRVHTDARAAEAASSIDARAFTSNRSIVFGAGEYTPLAESGRRLLAHELTHVVQQQAGVHLKDGLGQAGDVHEKSADAVADCVVQGGSAANLVSRIPRTVTLAIQRQENDPKRKKDDPLPQKLEFEFKRGLAQTHFTEYENAFLVNAVRYSDSVLIQGISYQGYDNASGWSTMPLPDLAQARADGIRNRIQNLLMTPEFGVAANLIPELMSKVVTQSIVRRRSGLLGRTEGAVVLRQ